MSMDTEAQMFRDLDVKSILDVKSVEFRSSSCICIYAILFLYLQ